MMVFKQYFVVRAIMQRDIEKVGSQYHWNDLCRMDFQQVKDLYSLHRPAILRREKEIAEKVLAGLEKLI